MNTARFHRGVTMVELAIALAIGALLVLLAAPSYQMWIADSQIRNAAQSVAAGLRLAQGEAIRRNEPTQFVIDPTPVTGGWTAFVVSGPVPPIMTAKFAEGATKTTTVVGPAAATEITFSGFGRIVGNADATGTITSIDFSSPVAGSRALRVRIGTLDAGSGLQVGNSIKLCDPAYPATDPKGCPP